jgi:MFS family permease
MYRKGVVILAFTLYNSSDVFFLLPRTNNAEQTILSNWHFIFYNLVYTVFTFLWVMVADRIGLQKMLVSGIGL